MSEERKETKTVLPAEFEQTAAPLLEKLCTAFGCSGHEDEVADTVIHAAPDRMRVFTDSMQNIYMACEPVSDHQIQNSNKTPGRDLSVIENRVFDVLLDAHMDEVGFMVKSIHRNGTFSMLPVGGWDLKNAAGACFQILSTKGNPVSAIAISRPVHFGKQETEAAWLIADAGCSDADEVRKLGIETGCFAVPEASFSFNPASALIRGKALDDRIGVCAELMTLRSLASQNRGQDVLGLFTAQEEVGERGALCAVSHIRAKAAICFEGCPADDTFADPDEISTRLGSGPMVRVIDRSSITDYRLISRIRKVAETEEIPLQIAARSGGGTNAAVFQQHNIPCAVIGIPVRYAHSLSGFSNMNDLYQAVRLALALIADLQKNPL